jgi:excisionase family DNA binding protein
MMTSQQRTIRLDDLAPLLSVAQVATRLSCSSKTVRRLIARDQLMSCRVGRLLRVSEAALAAYLCR